MTTTLHRLTLLLGSVLVIGFMLAAGTPPPTAAQSSAAVVASEAPTYHRDVLPPELSAAAYLVFDLETGEYLAASRPTVERPIASITKLFTAAAVEQLDPRATITVSDADVATYGLAGDLAAGQEYARRELLFPLLLESSNDAAATLARTGGSGFFDAMHRVAASAGATHSRFADSSGLSSGNVSTAADLARVLRYLSREHPSVLDASRLSRYLGPYGGWSNNNPVFDDPDYRGGKHGFTDAARLTIAALFAEDFAGGERTVGYIVLGSDDLRADIAALRTYVADSVRYE